MLFACWVRLYLNSPVYKYSVDLYDHCHFIVCIMLDDVGLECAQQDLSFYDGDWTAIGILQLGYRLLKKISTFCERVEIEKIGVSNSQTLVNTGIAIDKHMEE